jgi:hypothetical protein
LDADDNTTTITDADGAEKEGACETASKKSGGGGVNPSGIHQTKLDIRLGADGKPCLPDATVIPVTDPHSVVVAMQRAGERRACFQTNSNERSSRSHCLVMLDVYGTPASEKAADGEIEGVGAGAGVGAEEEELADGVAPSKAKAAARRCRGKLVLVDLAGSERVSKTGAAGARLKEAQNINKSLSALGDVMAALASKRDHVPFRNSKLTHLLQPSLGRDNKALMITQVNPEVSCHQESGCTMQFATRVHSVELGKAQKQAGGGGDGADVAKLKSKLAQMERTLNSGQQQTEAERKQQQRLVDQAEAARDDARRQMDSALDREKSAMERAKEANQMLLAAVDREKKAVTQVKQASIHARKAGKVEAAAEVEKKAAAAKHERIVEGLTQQREAREAKIRALEGELSIEAARSAEANNAAAAVKTALAAEKAKSKKLREKEKEREKEREREEKAASSRRASAAAVLSSPQPKGTTRTVAAKSRRASSLREMTRETTLRDGENPSSTLQLSAAAAAAAGAGTTRGIDSPRRALGEIQHVPSSVAAVAAATPVKTIDPLPSATTEEQNEPTAPSSGGSVGEGGEGAFGAMSAQLEAHDAADEVRDIELSMAHDTKACYYIFQSIFSHVSVYKFR